MRGLIQGGELVKTLRIKFVQQICKISQNLHKKEYYQLLGGERERERDRERAREWERESESEGESARERERETFSDVRL